MIFRGKAGFDLGRILKAEQKDICLVFLTSYAEFAVDSYVLEAYQYILKRDMKERLPAVLQKIYQEKQKESQNFFWIGGVTWTRENYIIKTLSVSARSKGRSMLNL